MAVTDISKAAKKAHKLVLQMQKLELVRVCSPALPALSFLIEKSKLLINKSRWSSLVLIYPECEESAELVQCNRVGGKKKSFWEGKPTLGLL